MSDRSQPGMTVDIVKTAQLSWSDLDTCAMWRVG